MSVPITNQFQAIIWNEALDAACEAVLKTRDDYPGFKRSALQIHLTEVILGRLHLLKRYPDGT